MRFFRLLIILLAVGGAARAGTLSADLAARLAGPTAGQVSAIAYLTSAAPAGAYPAEAAIAARKARAHATQGPLLSALASRGITNIRPLWVVNAVAFDAPPAVIRAIAARPDVRVVDADPLMPSIEPTPEPEEPTDGGGAATVNWNISRIGADSLWATGNTGQGVRVGIIDTGVDVNHPALIGKMAPGGWFDAVSGKKAAYDDNGHGTHVTGIVVGGDVAGSSIGVAPGAKYLAAKALNATSSFMFSWVLAAGQWLLDPNGDGKTDDAPDIINCSWAFSTRGAADYHPMLELWRAAGILPVFAIGNSGPSAATALPPGTDPLVFGVGATNAYDVLADFSGRGPAPSNAPFNGVLKPDLVAPGVNIFSAQRGGGTARMDGTSQAAPHVAGALALLRKQFPGITYEAAYRRLTLSAADKGAMGPDMLYGYGLLNVYAAMQLPAPVGDANGDGIVTPADVALALKIAGGLVNDKAAATRADVANPKGRVDLVDAITILRSYNGL